MTCLLSTACIQRKRNIPFSSSYDASTANSISPKYCVEFWKCQRIYFRKMFHRYDNHCSGTTGLVAFSILSFVCPVISLSHKYYPCFANKYAECTNPQLPLECLLKSFGRIYGGHHSQSADATFASGNCSCVCNCDEYLQCNSEFGILACTLCLVNVSQNTLTQSHSAHKQRFHFRTVRALAAFLLWQPSA